MKATVRLASFRDLPAIKGLYSSAAEEQEKLKPGWATMADWGLAAPDVIEATVSRGVLGGCPTATFVCHIDSVVVGYVIASVEPFPGGDLNGSSRRLRICHLFVDEEARGVGVGELLLAAASRWGSSQDVSVCEMEVLPGHRAAKNFCEAHGLKARAITMSGAVADVLSAVDMDEEESSSIDAAVQSALARPIPNGSASRPVAAGCIAVRKGRILLAQRSEPPFVNHWSIPGGTPEPGETLLDCARREMLEETGIDVKIVGIAGVAERSWESESEGQSILMIVNFLGVPTQTNPDPLVHTKEHKDLAWVVLDSLPKPLAPGIDEFLDRVRPVIEVISEGGSLPGVAAYSPPQLSK